MKKTISFILIFCLILSLSINCFSDYESCTVIGADLSEDQVSTVYDLFGIRPGSVTELKVHNSEEREYLEGLIDENIIGSKSISCIYIRLLDEGEGLSVKTDNITWVTSEMYKNALHTAGIDDADIYVAAPFEVSGTAALTGIYKAYEYMTGETISLSAKTAATQELTITAELADKIGAVDSIELVNALKAVLDETRNMSDEEVLAQIDAISAQYNIVLTDNQKTKLLNMCRSMESADDSQLLSRVDELKETLQKVSSTKEKLSETVDKVSGFFEKFSDTVSKFTTFVGNIFNKNSKAPETEADAE